MRVRDGRGKETFLVVEVPRDGGVIRASVRKGAVEWTSEEVSKLRQILQDAQAVVLREHGW